FRLVAKMVADRPGLGGLPRTKTENPASLNHDPPGGHAPRGTTTDSAGNLTLSSKSVALPIELRPRTLSQNLLDPSAPATSADPGSAIATPASGRGYSTPIRYRRKLDPVHHEDLARRLDLEIGAADSDPVDVDERLVRPRRLFARREIEIRGRIRGRE